ncbi:MAG: hypothetical protein WAU86_07110, partial [Oricola sp.]
EAQLEAGARTATAWIAPPAAPRPVSRTGIFWQGRYVRPGETPWAPGEPAATPVRPSFPLFDAPIGSDPDSPRRFGKPRIRSLWGPSSPEPEPREAPFPDGEVGAAGVCRRLVALKQALDDLPGHALRFARKNARRDFAEAALLAAFDPSDEAQRQALNRFCYTPAMRIGRPPGRRRRGRRPIDEILSECHQLALMARHRGPGSAEPQARSLRAG